MLQSRWNLPTKLAYQVAGHQMREPAESAKPDLGWPCCGSAEVWLAKCHSATLVATDVGNFDKQPQRILPVDDHGSPDAALFSITIPSCLRQPQPTRYRAPIPVSWQCDMGRDKYAPRSSEEANWSRCAAPKKKNNKKKKNANKNKEPTQLGNEGVKRADDEADDEPESPTQAVC